MASQETTYENLLFPDPELPIIFHFDQVKPGTDVVMHWQDSPELLYFTQGAAEVTSDMEKAECRAGDVAWIGSSHLHSIRALTGDCGYYCLIADREIFDRQGLPAADLPLKLRMSDSLLRELFDQIVMETLSQHPYYKAAVRAHLTAMAVHICRYYLDRPSTAAAAQNRKIAMVKAAIRYLQQHFAGEVTIGQVSAAVGFSKYYFCRGFKEVTGRTVVDYLNFIRCSHARRLLATGRYNVSESAERSGFTTLSYFTRMYKRYMGVLPSKEES